jgi:hypothetical protein
MSAPYSSEDPADAFGPRPFTPRSNVVPLHVRQERAARQHLYAVPACDRRVEVVPAGHDHLLDAEFERGPWTPDGDAA